MTTYFVSVIYRGACTFQVEASDHREACDKAEAAFRNGDEPIVTGSEWEEYDEICDVITKWPDVKA